MITPASFTTRPSRTIQAMLVGYEDDEVEAAREWIRSLGITVTAADMMNRAMIRIPLTESTEFQISTGQYAIWDGSELSRATKEAFELVYAPSS
jgi:hypothetical protein